MKTLLKNLLNKFFGPPKWQQEQDKVLKQTAETYREILRIIEEIKEQKR